MSYQIRPAVKTARNTLSGQRGNLTRQFNGNNRLKMHPPKGRSVFPLDFCGGAANTWHNYMARLLVKTEGLGLQAIELRMGVNHVGRSRDCEICLPHTTVSSQHAELALSHDGVYLRDLNSTNGTFLNGEPVAESWLQPGHEIRFGDVELAVESTDALIAIPDLQQGEPPPAAPVVLENGLEACPRHETVAATFRCPHCTTLMCNACVRVLKLQGGKPHYHCRLCSKECERMVVDVKKKKGFLEMLQATVRFTFKHPGKK